MANIAVPFFRPDIREGEIRAVGDVLRSGWLTTGPLVTKFERQFAAAVGARHAVAVNSCTAALHLAVDALGLSEGQAVLVPTLTFAATAEVVRYERAVPILVDCDPETLLMDLGDAARRIGRSSSRDLLPSSITDAPVVGMMPVHVGGYMLDVAAMHAFAARYGLWIVEDAAHAFPAAWRGHQSDAWRRCGDRTGTVTCFSFYANKCITTAEGGMAVTEHADLADRMRVMSLHGLSSDAWGRYNGHGSWDYRIMSPGYKYNLTDIAAAIGLEQLARADAMRRRRQDIAAAYIDALSNVEEIELPVRSSSRVHSWHLFPIRLRLEKLAVTRDEFFAELSDAGIHCSVHWRPLHLHPYYQETFGWRPEHCPVATATWKRLLSLPIFPTMTDGDVQAVITAVSTVCSRHTRHVLVGAGA